MKKITAMVLALFCFVMVFTMAGAQESPVRVIGMKGPTSMGMVQMMEAADQGTSDYEFSILAATDEVTASIVQGKVDISAVPANLASVLYNRTKGGVKVLAINTLGVVYIVEKGDTIQSVADLKGKTIFATGKTATPGMALNYILTKNGIDPEKDVTIEWKTESAEVLSELASGAATIAMLPQPFVTAAQAKVKDLRIALDLTDEWEKIQANETQKSMLITGVVVARTEFVDQNPEKVADFLKQYEQSVVFTNENVDEAAALIGKFGIVEEAVAKKALPYCNVTFIAGEEMKENLSGYLTVLFGQNPEAVGGALPADDFYYIQN